MWLILLKDIKEGSQYPGQCVLVLGLDPKSWQGLTGQAGAVCQLLHTTDMAHGLLTLPQCRGWDLHIILLV